MLDGLAAILRGSADESHQKQCAAIVRVAVARDKEAKVVSFAPGVVARAAVKQPPAHTLGPPTF
jgi:hypothetical protein